MENTKLKKIATKSGFSFTPSEHLFDNWDFLAAVTGRMASSKLTEAETVAVYFEAVDLLLLGAPESARQEEGLCFLQPKSVNLIRQGHLKRRCGKR